MSFSSSSSSSSSSLPFGSASSSSSLQGPSISQCLDKAFSFSSQSFSKHQSSIMSSSSMYSNFKTDSSSCRNSYSSSNSSSPFVVVGGDDHHETLNQAWRLCCHQRWMSLQMRLGVVPHEGRVISKQSQTSMLHVACRSSSSLQQGQEGRISSLIVKSIYYACPQALMLRDTSMGRTPLHYALAIGRETVRTRDIESNIVPWVPLRLVLEEPRPQPSLDIVCTLLDLSQGGKDPDDEMNFMEEEEHAGGVSSLGEDEDHEQVVGLIQDDLGDTPLHTACRYGASKQVLRELLDSCPNALLKMDSEGMSPIRRLWTRLETSEHTSLILNSEIRTYRDLVRYPFIKETWDKLIMFLQFLSTWELAEDEDETGRGDDSDEEDEESSPELSFQILHSIAANDGPGNLMKLALKLYPEEFLELDDCGQSILDIAIAQPVVSSTTEEKEESCVIDVLMEHDGIADGEGTKKTKKAGALYKICSQNCCHSRPPLHRAIVAGHGWNDGIEALVSYRGDVESVVEVDPITGLYPFMMAASTSKDVAGKPIQETRQVGTIFELLKRAPELVLPQCSVNTVSSSTASSSKATTESRRSLPSRSGKRKHFEEEEKEQLDGEESPQESNKKLKGVGPSLVELNHTPVVGPRKEDNASLFWNFL